MILSIEERIGVSTHFLPSTHGEDIFDAIHMVHKAGFEGFEIVPTLDQAQLGYPENHPNVGIDLFEATSEDIDLLKEALRVFKWVTVHAPHVDWNLSSPNRHLRKLTWEYYDKCFQFAIEIGAISITYHLGHQIPGYVRDQKKIRDYNVDYARHLIQKAKRHKIAVGFETGSFEDLKYVCDRVEGWGINLDIGHAYMIAGTDKGFFDYIDEFKEKIVEVHHNGVNQYWGGYMEHQPVHLNNMIDFQGVYEKLKEIGYAGPIVCEIQGQDIKQVIEHCQEAKEMISGIWNGTRPLKERWNVPKMIR